MWGWACASSGEGSSRARSDNQHDQRWHGWRRRRDRDAPRSTLNRSCRNSGGADRASDSGLGADPIAVTENRPKVLPPPSARGDDGRGRNEPPPPPPAAGPDAPLSDRPTLPAPKRRPPKRAPLLPPLKDAAKLGSGCALEASDSDGSASIASS